MQQAINGLQFWPSIILQSITKSGKNNVDADALSRIPWEDQDQYTEAESVQAIILNTFNSTIIEAYLCHIQVH